ncbi:MAG: PAS domain-containing protein, partial [Alphaproteobacteria bacterium]|nr:PAS domain-containing protein [Alphaproteobacteria bacterium]
MHDERFKFAGPSRFACNSLDIAPCGFATTTRDGTIIWANRRFLSWVGLDRDEIQGRRRFQ